MMQLIFDKISSGSQDIEFSVKCQYYQIYNEKIRDLLDTRKTDLAIREDKNKGIWVEDCTEEYVESEQEMFNFFQNGAANRAVASTKMNALSSRSHSLFAVIIYQRNIITESSKTGKIYFVDLAGSEKMAKAGIEGNAQLKEAQNINKSIMTLGMVINALTKGAKHVPYRDSKLTRVLQESLGGNSLTNLIINCSPSMINQAESLSTLRFGQRAKLIKNKVVANTQQSVKELMMKLKQAEEKIKALEEIIGAGNGGATTDDDKNKKKCPECKKLINQINYLTIQNNNCQQDNEYLQKDKEDLQEEIKNKNKELLVLTEKIQNLERKIKNISQEQLKSYTEIQKNMEDYTNIVKKIQSSINSRNYSEVNKLNDSAYKKWIELMGKLGVELKIHNLKNSNGQNEDISFSKGYSNDKLEMSEEEFSEKEKQYLKTIEELKDKIKNNQSTQSNQIVKNNLKIIDKSTLEELSSQLKDYLFRSKSTKLVRDMNKKISDSLITIINNNFNITTLNKLEKQKLSSRLQICKGESIELSSFSKLMNVSENHIIDNITNEALLKSVNEKNSRIIRLESDVKEYKEKLQLFESQLTPDEKNLHKKIYTLEKNLEQVNSMYHQIVTQKSVLKIENQIFEKKLKKRNDKINSLMKENYNLLEQLKLKDDKINGYQKNKDTPAPRLIKVIRGSGNKSGKGNNRTRSTEKFSAIDDNYKI
jgi:kinesin family protein 5